MPSYEVYPPPPPLTPLKDTSAYVTVSHDRCLDTTTMTMTCIAYNSVVLVWIVNGSRLEKYLSPNIMDKTTYVATTSGVNCTAYRTWVNETSQTIQSNITCTGLSGLSGPLPILCKSDDDNGGVCSVVLENTSCAMNASNNSSSKCVYT